MTRAELLAEAYRRNLLPADQRAHYEEGVRRGIVRDDFAKGKLAGKGANFGATAVFDANIPFLDEGKAALKAGVATAQGRGSFGDNWRAARDWQQGAQAGYREAHPIAANAVQAGAFGVQSIPALLSGGGTTAPNLFAATPTTLKGKVAKAAADVGRNAAIGGAYAAGNAFADRGTLSERAKAAGDAVPAGMVIGAAVPALIQLPGATKRVAGAATAPARRATVRATNNVVERVTGKPFLDPQQQAFQRLGESLKADGFTPEEIQGALAEWNRVGGPTPAFMDLIAKKGQRTMALIRGAAMTGGGRQVAAQYGNQVAADLQDNAIARTRALTPNEPRSALAVTEDVKRMRGAAAREMYPAFADQRVPVGDDIVSAAANGEEWMGSALKLARAERNDQVANEITALLQGERPRTVSAGALDYMRRSLRDAGATAARNGQGSLGQALRDRAGDLETALRDVPGFRDARDTYHGFSRALDSMNGNAKRGIVGGRDVLTTMPDEYAAAAQEWPSLGPYRQVGARQALTDQIGTPAEGSTGVLNRIATGTNPGRNLSATFGEDATADYRQAIGNMVDQLNTARFINPNTNSQSAGRLADQALVEDPPSSWSKIGLIRFALDKLRRGATLTDAEREALVSVATAKMRGEETSNVENLFAAPPPRPPLGDYSQANVFAIPAGQPNSNDRRR
jgi:hypothetical protein